MIRCGIVGNERLGRVWMKKDLIWFKKIKFEEENIWKKKFIKLDILENIKEK